MFFRVAQAISETLPNEAKEKKLLDGFLAGRNRIQEEMRKGTGQQAIAETLPNEIEKKLHNMSLAGKKKVKKENKIDSGQQKLFE